MDENRITLLFLRRCKVHKLTRSQGGSCALPILAILAMTLLGTVSGCGPSKADAPTAVEERQIRKPYPTFTPTTAANEPIVQEATAPAQAAAEAAATPTQAPLAQPTAAPTDAPPTATPTVAPPRLIVNTADVNVRAGPGTNYPILTTVGRGKEMDIVGKDQTGNWWRACCVDGQPIWIIKDFVDVDGAVDSVAVSSEVAQLPPTNTPPPAAPAQAQPTQPAPPTNTPPPTQAPAPTFSFDLIVQEQFPEPQIVRIFLYVFEGSRALEGYSLRVTKDGAPQTVGVTSFGGQPALTWPIADARQRFHNMKVEFPGVPAAGSWEVQLIDSGGAPVGPAALFQLKGNEPNQELYVRYKKK